MKKPINSSVAPKKSLKPGSKPTGKKTAPALVSQTPLSSGSSGLEKAEKVLDEMLYAHRDLHNFHMDKHVGWTEAEVLKQEQSLEKAFNKLYMKVQLELAASRRFK